MNTLSFFTCPVCGKPLIGSKTFRCENNHTYDQNKHGYLNLLMSNAASGKRHGDDKLMVLARSEFLEKGFYAPVRQALTAALLCHAVPNMRILDAGCGEGWYTAYFAKALEAYTPAIAGVDISKDALRQAAKRGLTQLAVASTAKLPVASESCQAVLNIFSPPELEEFHRVLAPGGVLIRALPMEDHLLGLKQAVYETALRNPAPVREIPGFRLVDATPVQYAISLDNAEDIWNLFTMTPYYYKTGKADQEKLKQQTHLTTQVEILVLTYQKTTF